MSLSLNQIVSRVRTLALSHHQINSFYFGDVPEFDANSDIQFPALFLEMTAGTIDRTAKQQRFNFTMYLYDLVTVSTDTEGNETEVISDMLSAGVDMLAMLMNPIYDDDWTIVDSSTYQADTEQLNDMVAGARIDIGILVDFFADSCQVPADDTEFDQTFDMPRTKIYHYTGTGSEGSTIAIAGLSGKHILAVYRADSYKRAIATLPTDAGKVQVGTVALGSDKGILGDGTVRFESGDGLINGEKLDVLYYA